MNKSHLLMHNHQYYDLVNKLEGWIRSARQDKPGQSGFLDFRQQELVGNLMCKEGIVVEWSGGFTNPLRQVAYWNCTDPVVLLRLETARELPTHQQLFGWLLNEQGFDFQRFGDIYLVQNTGWIALTNPLARLLQTQPWTIGGVVVQFVIETSPITIEYVFTESQKSLASLRLDVAVAALVGCSREQAQKMIAQKMVYWNFALCTEQSKVFAQGDIISIKKNGRFLVGDVKITKNNHWRVVFKQFR